MCPYQIIFTIKDSFNFRVQTFFREEQHFIHNNLSIKCLRVHQIGELTFSFCETCERKSFKVHQLSVSLVYYLEKLKKIRESHRASANV